jgi:hypothetical protein
MRRNPSYPVVQVPKEHPGLDATPAERLVRRLEARIDETVERILEAFVEQIPAYAALSDPVLRDDVRKSVRDNVAEWFRVVREQRPPNDDELTEFIVGARQRVHQGISLEALLHAYRLGATVAWGVILEESQGGRAVELKAALDVAGWLMRYLDHVSTAVAQAYLEEREQMVVDEERRHLEIAEVLLVHGCSSPEAEACFVEVGLKRASAYWVALVTCEAPSHELRQVAQRLRGWDSPLSVIAVTREPGVLILWPADDADVSQELEKVRLDLAAKRGDVLIALAGPTDEPLLDRLDEVRALARAGAGESKIIRLEDAPFEMLVQSVEGRVGGMIRKLVETVSQYDRARGSGLLETLRTYIECSLSLRDTARALMVHRNTVAYRLERIHSLTGLSPRVIPELFLLYVGLELEASDRLPHPAASASAR